MIRKARLDDSQHISEIHVRGWQVAYRGILPEAYLDDLDTDQRMAFWEKEISEGSSQVFVWESEGRIFGWINFGQYREEGYDRCGEINAVYVDPESWGKGIGSKLMQYAHGYLYRENFSQVHLWVLEKNHRTINFYRRLGYEAEDRRRELVFAGQNVVEQRYILTLPGS